MMALQPYLMQNNERSPVLKQHIGQIIVSYHLRITAAMIEGAAANISIICQCNDDKKQQ